MMRILASTLAATLLAGSAQAATTVLTFNTGETACAAADNAPASQACTTDGQFLGANYGSTAQLAVSYDASESTGSRTSLNYTSDDFFATTDGQAYSTSPGPATELSKIIFTPLAGYEVSFRSFIYDKLTATTSADFTFEVRDAADAVVWSGGSIAAHGYTVNTAYFTGPVTFLFGNGGRGAVAVDNVTVDVREVAVTAVPEPSQWALLIAGFGMVGGAVRNARRRREISC